MKSPSTVSYIFSTVLRTLDKGKMIPVTTLTRDSKIDKGAKFKAPGGRYISRVYVYFTAAAIARETFSGAGIRRSGHSYRFSRERRTH